MEAFLAQIDAADASEVPALCLLLADWLSERGDPQAEGWRALGVLGKCPYPGKSINAWHYWWLNAAPEDCDVLPQAWWDKLAQKSTSSRSGSLLMASTTFIQLPHGVQLIYADRKLDERDSAKIRVPDSPTHDGFR